MFSLSARQDNLTCPIQPLCHLTRLTNAFCTSLSGVQRTFAHELLATQLRAGLTQPYGKRSAASLRRPAAAVRRRYGGSRKRQNICWEADLRACRSDCVQGNFGKTLRGKSGTIAGVTSWS